MTATKAREEILGSVRRALGRDAKPEALRAKARVWEPSELENLAAEISRDCEQRRGKLIEQFESELTRVGGLFHRASSSESAARYIDHVASERQATSIVSWDVPLDVPLIEGVDLRKRLEQKGIQLTTETSDGEFLRVAARSDIGLSGVDYALADTGTLVLLTGKGRARSISLLPPVHIALLKPQQVIPGLDALFPLLRHERARANEDLSSAITFITGPSRTADIELTIVVGVHGPQQLHVVLLEN